MVAAIGAVGAIGGALISSNAAGDAAEGQQQATQQANALQAQMFQQNIALNSPNINTGNAARDRLAYMLGLSPTGYSGTTSVNGIGQPSSQPQTYDQYRQQLLSQYTKNVTGSAGAPDYSQNANYQSLIRAGMNPEGAASLMQVDAANDAQRNANNSGDIGQRFFGYQNSGQGGSTSQVDEAGLDAAIKAAMAKDEATRQAAIDAAKNDPNYGRLAQQYVPDKFSFTSQDFLNNKDPGYEWRLQQGQKALDRQGAAAGRFLSGSQLQASSDYNQGAALQEYGNAYSRAMSTFGTNEGNRFQAYQANFNNAVNPLLSLAGAATLGSQNLGNAGSNYASQVGNNLTNNANAQGAAGIAGANAIGNSVSGAVGSYQQNQLLSNLIKNNSNINNNPYGGGTLPNPSAYDFSRD